MEKLKIVLASASPRRAELMRQIGLEFQVFPSAIREKNGKERNPRKLAEWLAYAKARDVADRLSGRQGRQEIWVLGADTLVWLDGRPLGKPKGPKDAARMLKKLSNRTHQVITGLALVRVGGEQAQPPVETQHAASLRGVETTSVTFRKLSNAEINDYVASGEPMDKAGAYGIQGLAGLFVKRIAGCYFNVVGLPLARLAEMLKKTGAR